MEADDDDNDFNCLPGYWPLSLSTYVFAGYNNNSTTCKRGVKVLSRGFWDGLRYIYFLIFALEPYKSFIAKFCSFTLRTEVFDNYFGDDIFRRTVKGQ